jgi:sarcosine oxidase subunit beta
MSSTADAVIVGGGVVGTSVAFHLALLGMGRVVLCERRFLAAGATGKSGALVRTHYTNEPEARLAFASLPYFAHWNDMVGLGTAGFLDTGLLRIVSPENEAKLRANVAMLRRVGIDTSVVGSDDVTRLSHPGTCRTLPPPHSSRNRGALIPWRRRTVLPAGRASWAPTFDCTRP